MYRVQILCLFYLISHLRLGPSNLFYRVSPLCSCLRFGSKCLKISWCFELGVSTQGLRLELQEV